MRYERKKENQAGNFLRRIRTKGTNTRNLIAYVICFRILEIVVESKAVALRWLL
jgi:hypothetical protein